MGKTEAFRQAHQHQYNQEQLELLRRVKNDFIFKDEIEFSTFIKNFFGEFFESQFYISHAIYKTVLNYKTIYRSIHAYLGVTL